MLTEQQVSRVIAAWPGFSQAAPEVLRALRDHSTVMRLLAEKKVFTLGDEVSAIPLVLSGMVRVYKIAESGREITLYRFGVGESCVLTANAVLNKAGFAAVAVVESEVEAVMVPSESFREWVRRYDLWREFAFTLLTQRLASLVEVVDEVAFQRMDSRVARLLLERAAASNPIAITHHEIAADLGSSREVISRILEGLATQGVVRIGRGALEIINAAALETLALR